MNTSKIIKGVVSNGRYTVTAPIVKEDYGLYLQIEGVELPSTYEVDFSNSENSGTSVAMIGNADGVLIPRQFIDSGKDVFAFLYHVGEDFGRTVYKFRIPNKVRPDRTNEEPTPEEQSVIDQTISALNEAVESAQDAQQAIEDMSVSATTLAEGSTATVTKTESEGVVHLEFGIPRGATGAQGERGEKGDKGDTGEVTQAEFDELSGEVTDLKEGLQDLEGSVVKTVNNIAPDANGNVNVEGGGEAVTDTVTGESVTFVTNDTSPKALSVTLESTISDTSGATPTNPVSITGITSETFTVNGTDKVVNLANPIGKGTWDVLTGEVVDERPVIDFTADMVNSLAKVGNIYAIKVVVGIPINANGIIACSHYPVWKSGAVVYPVIRYVNGKYYLYDDNITENNLQTAREYINNLGAKLVLDPVTPVELSETPETITLVNGENTVAVSTGEMSLTYAVDIKGYVDGKVASVEDTANEALDTANGLDARVTANTELSETNEQKVYKFRTDTGSNTGTGSAGTANTTRWGFRLDIDEAVEKCYSVTFVPQFPSSVTGEYTATRWKKESGTPASGDVLTKVDEVTNAVGESVTFDALGVNEFISLNKSCQRSSDGNGDNMRYIRMGYVNETTGAYTSFSGFLSGSFEVTFCKPVKDDSMPLYGTKIALVGDSITEYNGRASINHAMYLKDWTGAVVQNLGVGSTGFSTNNKYKDRIANIKADTEIIGVAASLNDMRNTVGTASDTASDETVCGYANEFFDLLLASFPSIPIVCYSEGAWNTYRPGVTKSDTYMEQMKQICLNKGVAWDDGLYRGCALRPWIQANREALYKGEWGSYTDVVDDIHPNSEGQRYIAIYLQKLFEKYVRD